VPVCYVEPLPLRVRLLGGVQTMPFQHVSGRFQEGVVRLWRGCVEVIEHLKLSS